MEEEVLKSYTRLSRYTVEYHPGGNKCSQHGGHCRRQLIVSTRLCVCLLVCVDLCVFLRKRVSAKTALSSYFPTDRNRRLIRPLFSITLFFSPTVAIAFRLANGQGGAALK